MRNKAQPEGSIAETYTVKIDERNEDQFERRVQGCLSIFSQQARLLGSQQHLQCSKEVLAKAHWYIMNNCPKLRP